MARRDWRTADYQPEGSENTAREYAQLPRMYHRQSGDAPTPRQLAVLRCLVEHIRAHGYAPTWRDLCRATGMRSTNAVSDHLKRLEGKGLLRRTRNDGRRAGVFPSLQITDAGKVALGMDPDACIHCGRGGA